MNIKLRLKVGTTEVEYEGEKEFAVSGLSSVLSELAKSLPTDNDLDIKPPNDKNPEESPEKGSRSSQLSVRSIAAKLDVKNAPELVLATCAFLTLMKNKDVMDRKEILNSMKEATGYYEQNYRKNLTNTLQNLLSSGKLQESAKEKYVLSAAQREYLENQLK